MPGHDLPFEPMRTYHICQIAENGGVRRHAEIGVNVQRFPEFACQTRGEQEMLSRVRILIADGADDVAAHGHCRPH